MVLLQVKLTTPSPHPQAHKDKENAYSNTATPHRTSDEQKLRNDEASQIAQKSQTQLSRLEARLSRYEIFVDKFLDRYSIYADDSAGTNLLKSTIEDVQETFVLPRETVPTGMPTTRLSSLLIAIRHRLAEIIFMLLCFLPAVRRIYDAFAILARAPTMLLGDNIILQDALGRSLSLPYNDFRHWEVFQARLNVAFQDCPGHRKVRNTEFLIMDVHSGVMLSRESWSLAVSPKAKLSMSMLYYGEDFQGLLCPQCHQVTAVDTFGKVTTCPSCSRRYWPKEALRLNNKPQGHWCPKDPRTGMDYVLGKRKSDMAFTASEIQMFKKVHLVDNRPARIRADPNSTNTPGQDSSPPLEPSDVTRSGWQCHVCEIEFESDLDCESHASMCNREVDLYAGLEQSRKIAAPHDITPSSSDRANYRRHRHFAGHDDQMFVCKICSARFFEKDLKRHKRTHSPENRFYCAFEGCKLATEGFEGCLYVTKGFGRRDHLTRHKQKEH